MSADAAYLDTSAFVKLILLEAESTALKRYLQTWPRWCSATLLRTEAARALRRQGLAYLAPARQIFTWMNLIRMDEPLLDRAGELDPPDIRSLDAVHVAAALSLGSELGVFVTYDQRMADAARQYGLTVCDPR